MIRALFRLLSLIALAVAVIMAVLDATRSIAAETLVLTPLGVSWQAVAPTLLDQLQQSMTQTLPAFFWSPVTTSILAQPGFAVFVAVALVLAFIGHRSRRPGNRVAFGR